LFLGVAGWWDRGGGGAGVVGWAAVELVWGGGGLPTVFCLEGGTLL